MKLNINDIIKVKLRDEGYQRLANIHNRFIGDIPNWEHRDIDYYKSKADADGYTKMQMWCFMQDFGPIIRLGKLTPFESDILIEDIKPE